MAATRKPAGAGKDDWCTPRWLVDLIVEFAEPRGGIDLDPCGNAGSIVPAKRSWWGRDAADKKHAACGLRGAWGSSSFVYVNPPYSDPDPWVAKAELEAAGGAEIVMLLPSDTGVGWFQKRIVCRQAYHADAVLFLNRRVSFIGASGSPPFASMVPYWGGRAEEFRNHFRRYGWTVLLSRRRR